jgi:ribosomal protein S28E/S33
MVYRNDFCPLQEGDFLVVYDALEEAKKVEEPAERARLIGVSFIS